MFNRLAAIRELKIMNSVWGVLLRLVLWIGTPVLTIWFYEIWWLPLTIGSILIFLIRPINMQQCADLENGNSSDHEAERERDERPTQRLKRKKEGTTNTSKNSKENAKSSLSTST